MMYTDRIRMAAKLANHIHKDQIDNGGYPYIMHPIHIAEQMDTEEEVIVALLHDVIEDAEENQRGWVIIQIRELKLSKSATEALELLTKDTKINYNVYIENIRNNKMATKIKVADLKHNLDRTRLRGGSKNLLEQRYKDALEILEQKI